MTRAEFGRLGSLRGAYRGLARCANLALHGFHALGLALARAEGLEELRLLLLWGTHEWARVSAVKFTGA